jgi:hypothetical protein
MKSEIPEICPHQEWSVDFKKWLEINGQAYRSGIKGILHPDYTVKSESRPEMPVIIIIIVMIVIKGTVILIIFVPADKTNMGATSEIKEHVFNTV